MSSLFVLPFNPAFGLAGTLLGAGTLTFYRSGTSTLAPILDDDDDPLPNPVTADAFGRFPSIYFGASYNYRVVLKSALGVVIGEIDPYPPTGGGNLADTLAALKATPVENIAVYYDGAWFTWTLGNYSGQADDNNIIQSNYQPLSTGAWLRQMAAKINTAAGISVEAALAAITASASLSSGSDLAVRQQNAKAILAYPPFATANDDYSDLLPTVGTPVAACRLSATVIVVRCGTAFDVNGVCTAMTQYVFNDPAGYANVAGGWQLVAEQGIVYAALHDFFRSPTAQQYVPNADFAFRIGPFASTYNSGGEGPDYAYAGFGHGRCINVPANNQIFLNANTALNLQSTANWPIGTRLYGSTLQINTAFFLTYFTGVALGTNPITTTNGSGVVSVAQVAHGYTTGKHVQLLNVPSVGINGITAAQLQAGGVVTVTGVDSFTMATTGTATSSGTGGGNGITSNYERVQVNYSQLLDSTGLRNIGSIKATTTGVGWQDFYGDLFPINRNAATAFKLNGLPAVTINNDLQQKGNWTNTIATSMQAYHAAYPTIVATHDLMYGQPIRKPDGSLAAWALNKFGRVFFRDLSDFPKLYVFGGSSEESLPRTAWPMALNDEYQWQNRKVVKIMPGGAA